VVCEFSDLAGNGVLIGRWFGIFQDLSGNGMEYMISTASRLAYTGMVVV
jgi:hypothetical protein